MRSYFSTDDRRKVGPMLRETARIDFKRTETPIEAAVLEIRLIHHLRPHYNSAGTRWDKAVYIRLTAERFPRLRIVRSAPADGSTYLGPIRSRAQAQLVVDAIEAVVPLRRCAAAKPTSRGPCIPAQLGVSLCRCNGPLEPEQYAPTADMARTCMQREPGLIVDALSDRMYDLAAQERFEEAGTTRDRLVAFSDAISRQRLLDRTRNATELIVEDRSGNRFEFHRGHLVRHWAPQHDTLGLAREIEARPPDPGGSETGPLDRELADELLMVGRWLERSVDQLRLIRVEGTLTSPVTPVPAPGRVTAVSR